MSIFDGISQTIIYIRNHKGLSRKQLALKCGIGVSYLRLIERGVADPTIRELQRIADALEVELRNPFVSRPIASQKKKSHAQSSGQRSLAESFRDPMIVRKIIVFQSDGVYPICPRCGISLDREYQAYCDRCGQKLDWRFYENSTVIRR